MEKSGRGKRRSFSDEYKAEAVRLVGESGKSIGAIARELGLGETALRRWVQQAEIDAWSLTSLQQRLVKTGGRLIKHARYYWLLLAESHLTRRLFARMLRRIAALPSPAG